MTLRNLDLRAIRDLLEDGLSYRVIAKRLGISRTTISKYADQLPSLEIDTDEDSAAGLDAWLQENDGLVQRCPTCGGKVTMPCKLCGVRAFLDRELKELEHGFDKRAVD